MSVKSSISFRFIAVLLGLLAATPTPAQEADRLAVILDQQRDLQKQIDAGNLRNLTPRQANVIRKAQTEVFAVTEGKTTLDSLSIEEKIRLDNALERINAEVKGGRVASEQQDVCWRERKSGSKMMVTRCGTQAERDEARRGARDWMEKPKICSGECGSLP
jgi:hypothetical protein